jgi:tRNA(Ile)-lysidine synthase
MYPKPKEMGGRLLRRIVAFLKNNDLPLPLDSHILCGVSGGSDSLALGVALAKYGRRIVSHNKVVWIHVNHGWRGEASDRDEAFVRRLAKKYGVHFESISMKSPPPKGESWEAHARMLRKSAYALASKKYQTSWVFTGHTADDLAETKLWRIFNGQWATHSQGIYPVHRYVAAGAFAGKLVEIRPLLSIRKQALKEFLLEEKLKWREDATNFEGRFLRSKIRMELMPVLEKIFPNAVENLNQI